MNCYLPDPGIKPTSLPSPALVGKLFTDCATWKQYTFQEPLPSVSTVHDQSRTKNIGRTVLISQGTVILGTLVITGTSQFLK